MVHVADGAHIAVRLLANELVSGQGAHCNRDEMSADTRRIILMRPILRHRSKDDIPNVLAVKMRVRGAAAASVANQ